MVAKHSLVKCNSLETKNLLFFGNDYKESFIRILGNSPVLKNGAVSSRFKPYFLKHLMTLKAAKIRKSTGRVGECRYIPVEQIGSITILENQKTQKRWYKCMVSFSEEGTKYGQPSIAIIYLYFLPALLSDLVFTVRQRNGRLTNKTSV